MQETPIYILMGVSGVKKLLKHITEGLAEYKCFTLPRNVGLPFKNGSDTCV